MNVYLRVVTEADRDLLFEWANEPLVRQNSFSEKEISYMEHIQWFERLLANKDCMQYIYMRGNEAVGQARIEAEGEMAVISYSICADKRGMGYGKHLLELLCIQAKKDFPGIQKFVGEVKEENIASKKAFLSAGFRKKSCIYEISVDECKKNSDGQDMDKG